MGQMLYNVLDGLLALEEGPPTFACKSQDADRQDWYIYFTFYLPSYRQ